MRLVLASMGAAEFSLLHTTAASAGHEVIAYAFSRSARPGQHPDAHSLATIGEVVAALPADVDLLLPAGPAGLGQALAAYQPDLLVIYGFNWILPAAVFRLPRLGTINIHRSLLPRYRGAAPVLWAIRNGDPEIGVTVHRVDDGVDTGPILAQRGGIPLDEDLTQESLRARLAPVVRELLTVALARVANGDPGLPQPTQGASRAPVIEPVFTLVNWSRPAREVHNQVRVFRFIGSQDAPLAGIGDHWRRLIHTSLEPADGLRVDCGDGPIWIVESEPVTPPFTRAAAAANAGARRR
jgi:methionyl-tRNA formyltransferase